MQARGAYGQMAAQYEEAYGEDPAVPDLTLIPIRPGETFRSTENHIQSDVLRGDRMTTEPGQGNIDVSGSIPTELGAYPGMLLVAAAGSVKTEGNGGTGETVGDALTTPAGVIDPFNQTLTITAETHGLAAGDVVLIAGLTAPTELNSTYCRVMSVTSANVFTCRIPLGVSTTWTLGSGTVKKVTKAATTYKHTIQFGGKLPSLLIEKGFTDIAQYFKYNGCVCGKMSLACKPEGFQELAFEFAGQMEEIDTTSFDASATDLGKVSFTGFQAAIEEGEAEIANVKTVSMEVENSLDTDQYVIGGQGLRSGLPEGRCKITGAVEALFENTALYAKALAFTTSSLEIEFTTGTGAGSEGNEKMTISVPHLKYGREAPAISGEAGVLVKLPFESFYTAGSSMCTITLLNTQLSI